MIQLLSFSHFLQDLICFVLGTICLHMMVVITVRKVITGVFFEVHSLYKLTRTLDEITMSAVTRLDLLCSTGWYYK